MTAPPSAEEIDRLPGRRSIAANTAYAFVLQSANAVFTIALTLFLVRALSTAKYGLFGLAVSVGGLLMIPADLGIGAATGRYVAQHYDEPTTVGRIVASAIRLRLLLTGTTCLALLVLAPLLARLWSSDGLVGPLRVMAFVLFGQSAMTLLCAVATALGRVDLNLWVYVTESLVEATTAIALVLGGAGVVGALVGKAIGYAVATVAALLIIGTLIGVKPSLLRSARGGWRSRLMRYGGAIVLVDSAFVLFSQIDVLLIGVFLTNSAVALFVAPLRFIIFLILPAGALTAGVAPRLAREADRQTEKFGLLRATRHVLVAQGFLVAPLLVWATPITDVLFGGGKYAGSTAVLRWLVVFVTLAGFGALFSLTANYLGQARRRLWIALLTVGINIVVDVILIPRVGVVGGAIGTDVAYLFYAPAHALICTRMLGLSFRSLGRPLASVLLGAGAMSATLAVFGTGHLGVARIVAGAMLASAVYACFVLLGAVTPGERRYLLVKTRAGLRGLRQARSAG